MSAGAVRLVEGDLLDQQVEVIVNPWNRNIIPWWLLLPQGVSGAILRRGGFRPFIEVGRAGAIPLGGAVVTSAGRLPFRGVIHVASIDLLWRASVRSIKGSVAAAMAIVRTQGFASIGFPVLGAGVGGFSEAEALALMQRALAAEPTTPAEVTIVRFRRPT